MINRKLPSLIEKIQSHTNLLSYLVITAMMVCASITFIQVGYWFTADITGFQWGYIPFLAAVVSLEAIFTRPVARELEGREQILYHLAEWVTIAVLLKVIYYLVRGFGEILIDLPLWQENFITFFQGEYFYALIFLAAVWSISHISADDIESLNVDSTDTYWDIGKLMNTRGTIRQTLVSRFLWIGVILVLMVTIVRSSIIAAPASMGSQGPGHQYHGVFCPGIGALQPNTVCNSTRALVLAPDPNIKGPDWRLDTIQPGILCPPGNRIFPPADQLLHGAVGNVQRLFRPAGKSCGRGCSTAVAAGHLAPFAGGLYTPDPA